MQNAGAIRKLISEVGRTLEIDEQGRVWRIGRAWKDETKKIKTRKRAEYENTDGYLAVRVMRSGETSKALAHRLAYTHFKGSIRPGNVVHHVNGIKTDNRIENLQETTLSRNTKDAWVKGKIPPCGRKHRRFTPEEIRWIRKVCLSKAMTEKALGELLGVTRLTIHYISTKATYKDIL